jgi:Crinkler effector protein N-terminal domain
MHFSKSVQSLGSKLGFLLAAVCQATVCLEIYAFQDLWSDPSHSTFIELSLSGAGRWVDDCLLNFNHHHHIMAADQMVIWCVIPNEGILFSIEIQSSESVGTLKKEIYEATKNTFAEIDAAHLRLYQVEISDLYNMEKDEIKQAVTQILSKHPPELNLKRKLVNVFKEGLTEDTLIIVQPPPTW